MILFAQAVRLQHRLGGIGRHWRGILAYGFWFNADFRGPSLTAAVENHCHWLILGDFSGLSLPERVGRQGIEVEEYFRNGLDKAPGKNNKNTIRSK